MPRISFVCWPCLPWRSSANGEMRFVCASKYGDNYTLRIAIRKDPSGALWLDASAAAE